MKSKKVFIIFGIAALIFIVSFCVSVVELKKSDESSNLLESESTTQPYTLPKPIPVVWLTGR